jgi:hypothetical protein
MEATPTMADDAYWTEQSGRLDDPETGSFAFTPMSEAALIGHGPFLKVNDALKLMILGRTDEAKRLIDNFLPRLIARLHETEWTRALLELERTDRLAPLTEMAHLAYWLTEGSFRPDLARRAAATRWERGICPIPFVGLIDAARIVWACLSLRGLQPTLQTILPLLR